MVRIPPIYLTQVLLPVRHKHETADPCRDRTLSLGVLFNWLQFDLFWLVDTAVANEKGRTVPDKITYGYLWNWCFTVRFFLGAEWVLLVMKSTVLACSWTASPLGTGYLNIADKLAALLEYHSLGICGLHIHDDSTVTKEKTPAEILNSMPMKRMYHSVAFSLDVLLRFSWHQSKLCWLARHASICCVVTAWLWNCPWPKTGQRS